MVELKYTTKLTKNYENKIFFQKKINISLILINF